MALLCAAFLNEFVYLPVCLPYSTNMHIIYILKIKKMALLCAAFFERIRLPASLPSRFNKHAHNIHIKILKQGYF